jgi:hypothetical protein
MGDIVLSAGYRSPPVLFILGDTEATNHLHLLWNVFGQKVQRLFASACRASNDSQFS